MTIISLDTKAFNSAIKIASAIVDRNGVPVLNNARISVERNILTLVATDTEMWVTQTVPCEADTITATTLNAQMLAGIFGSLEDERAEIEIKGGDAFIRSGRSKFKLRTLPADQFPLPSSKSEGGGALEVKASQLATGLSATLYAASSEVVMPHLRGVRFETRGDTLHLVTFDSKRMAWAGLEYDCDEDIDGFTLPTKAASALVSLCGDGAIATISRVGTMARFDIGHASLLSKTLEGEFAPFERMLADPDGDPIYIDTATVSRALGRIALMADKQTKFIKCDAGLDTLTFALASDRNGDADEVVQVENEGRRFALAYNLQFLRDAFSTKGATECELFVDEQRRGIVRPIMPKGSPKISHFFANYPI